MFLPIESEVICMDRGSVFAIMLFIVFILTIIDLVFLGFLKIAWGSFWAIAFIVAIIFAIQIKREH